MANSCVDADGEDCIQRAMRAAFRNANTHMGSNGITKVCRGY